MTSEFIAFETHTVKLVLITNVGTFNEVAHCKINQSVEYVIDIVSVRVEMLIQSVTDYLIWQVTVTRIPVEYVTAVLMVIGQQILYRTS